MSATGMLVSAQEVYDYTKNPFGLVYREAITEKRVGEVNIHPVKYDLNGNEIAANIYTPANYDQSKEYAAIVISHPNGGVKEQTAGLYAQRLAELGYITIAADASYQGASGGEPRNLDIPQNRINDVRGMVDYISTYPGVDADRIGALDICGGGGLYFRGTPIRQTDKGRSYSEPVQYRASTSSRLSGFADDHRSRQTETSLGSTREIRS